MTVFYWLAAVAVVSLAGVAWWKRQVIKDYAEYFRLLAAALKGEIH
jgi:hypothetical protein